jgi:hypothetical protein
VLEERHEELARGEIGVDPPSASPRAGQHVVEVPPAEVVAVEYDRG